MNLIVPTAVRVGDSLNISCVYDLERETLYSVKFYRGDQEFYRYIPKESPPTKVFPMDGVNVDLSQSNSTRVTLTEVQRDLTGYYKCEVSADAPLFHTELRTAPVIVIEEPLSLPTVKTEKSKYAMGERIRANCTSEGGYPAANLTWYINGRQVRDNPPLTRQQGWLMTEGLKGLETSRLSLEMEATPGVFHEGKLKLECIATQFDLYNRSCHVILYEDTPQLAPVMGATAPHSHTDSGANIVVPSSIVMLWLSTSALQFYTR
ncbi:uncharacterized protein LOC142323857 [Lycorma delicatula]|uniref:uncharacterized protein LOC142323857 n=1 Tax=Lycorma delicatula TaxID=130591 RepID=UPI003F51305B